jgi:hypothetical protein
MMTDGIGICGVFKGNIPALLGGTELNHGNLSQDSLCTGRDSNWVPPECKYNRVRALFSWKRHD